LFTFEIGYLSLIEVGLLFLFILISQKIFNSFKDNENREIGRNKSILQILYLLLSFTAGLHFIGGEFQNFFILKQNFGPHMDMATFYDGIGHLFLFSFVILIIFFLVKSELKQQNKKPLTKTDFWFLIFQAIIVSFFAAITIIKSAFILLFLIPILGLIVFLFVHAGKPHRLILKNHPIYTFFSFLFLFSFVLLLAWIVLPNKLIQLIVREFISLGPKHKIETSFSEVPIFKLIMKVWE
jgi:hypothetical protein